MGKAIGQTNLTNTRPEAATYRVLATQQAVDAWKANKVALLVGLSAIEQWPYNWAGEGELPLREDVTRDLRYRVFGAYGMDLRNLPPAKMELDADGTVELTFTLSKRTVVLHFLCSGIISWWKSSDSGALIDGMITLPKGSPATGFSVEIDEVTGWLLEVEADWR